MHYYNATNFRNMKAIKEQGIDPYPTKFEYAFSVDDIVGNREKKDIDNNKEVIIIGRVTNKQIDSEFLEGVLTGWKNKIEFRIHASYKLCNYLDIGDIIQIKGKIKKERKNKVYLIAEEFIFATKSLRKYPTPKDWFQDFNKQKIQYEISLLVSDKLKDIFIKRCKVISVIRRFLEDQGFIEVDTPILLPLPVMAPVRDFATSQPQFNPKSYLRISNTDLMRRYLVSGINRIFHIGKFFRDEPLTFKSYFEFTMLTFGLAYATYNDIANIIEATIQRVIEEVFNKRKIFRFRNKIINFKSPWERISMSDAINQYANIKIEEHYDENSLRTKMNEKGITIKEEDLHAELIDKLLDIYVIPNLINPTYITDFPHFFGGPAKETPNDIRFKQRCELYINGVEIANMSTHENNPIKLRQWFVNTLKEKEKKGWSKQKLHEDYFFPMEIGSPPCASGAVGIDRLLMVLMNVDNIIDIVPYPWNFTQKLKEEIK